MVPTDDLYPDKLISSGDLKMAQKVDTNKGDSLPAPEGKIALTPNEWRGGAPVWLKGRTLCYSSLLDKGISRHKNESRNLATRSSFRNLMTTPLPVASIKEGVLLRNQVKRNRLQVVDFNKHRSEYSNFCHYRLSEADQGMFPPIRSRRKSDRIDLSPSVTPLRFSALSKSRDTRCLAAKRGQHINQMVKFDHSSLTIQNSLPGTGKYLGMNSNNPVTMDNPGCPGRHPGFCKADDYIHCNDEETENPRQKESSRGSVGGMDIRESNGEHRSDVVDNAEVESIAPQADDPDKDPLEKDNYFAQTGPSEIQEFDSSIDNKSVSVVTLTTKNLKAFQDRLEQTFPGINGTASGTESRLLHWLDSRCLDLYIPQTLPEIPSGDETGSDMITDDGVDL